MNTPDPQALRDAIAEAKARHNTPDYERPSPNGASKSFQIGVELVAGIALGAFLGLSADRWLDISPFGLLTGFAVGMAAAWRNIMRFAQRAERDANASSPPPPGIK